MSDVRSDADDPQPHDPAPDLPLPELDPALLAEATAEDDMDRTTAELAGPDEPRAPVLDSTVTMELGELDDALAAGAAARREMEAAETGEVASPEEDDAGDGEDATESAGPAPGTTESASPPSEPVEEGGPATGAAAPSEGRGEDADEEEDPLPDVPLSVRVEAVLFAATEPVSMARLRGMVATDDARELRSAVDSLAATYDATGRAFQLEEVAGGFQIRTRPELAALVTRSGRKQDTARLSGAALETLAIVAYRQPVLRADIEKIRGVASGEVLRTLIEREMVRVTARAELPGAPLLYGTTSRFLELFGLRNVRDLPRDPELLRPVE